MIRRLFIAGFALVLLISAICGLQAAAKLPAGESGGDTLRLPIVMYHEVKYAGLGKDVISPWEFESDLICLRENGFNTITMDELNGWFFGGASLPRCPIMLTFDDGYLNTYKYVLPLLKKYDMKIVLNLIVKDTDDFTRSQNDDTGYSHVTWPQVNDMLDTGLVEVQNHSYGLHAVKNGRYGCVRMEDETPASFEETLKEDLQRAQSVIFTRTGRVPTTFAYPFGRYCAETDTILRELGFQATLSCRYGINTLSRSTAPDLFRLKRLCRAHGVPLGTLVDEAYKTRL